MSLSGQMNESHKLRSQKKEEDTTLMISSGSTLLNLACSGTGTSAFKMGKIVNLIGDSFSGKTLLALSILAEASHNKKFDDYSLILDDVEAAYEFDTAALFGKKTEERLTIPLEPSYTVQDFHKNINECLKEGPFIYVLDSLDGLTTTSDLEKTEKLQKGESKTGSYHLEKPKVLGQILRQITAKIKKMNSLLIIISQTRDNLNSFFASKTRSGGHALLFHSSYEMWLSVKKKIPSAQQKYTKYIIGSAIEARVTKNKPTGKLRNAKFSIYQDFGVDDVGSCVDFLIESEYWKKKGSKIAVPEFEFEGMKKGLISLIEEKNLEVKLSRLTAKIWNEIEESLKLHRKRRYE